MKPLFLVSVICGCLWAPANAQTPVPADTIQLQSVAINAHGQTTVTPENTPEQTIDDAIDALPGVSLIKRGNYASEPVFRGLNGGQLSVTIEGMRIFSACTDKMDPVNSYLSANNLSSIAVSDNTLSVHHGSSIGGNIDFKTKNPAINHPQKWKGNVYQSWSSNSGTNTNASLTYSDSLWALNGNLNYQKFENYRAGGGQKIAYTQFEKLNFSLQSTVLLSKTWRMRALFIHDDAYDIGYAALPMDVSYAGGRIYSLSFKKYLPHGSVEWKGYGNHIVHYMDDSKRPDVPIRMDMPGRSNTYGAYLIWEFEMGKKHHITIHPDYYFNQSFADMTMYPNHKERPNEPTMYMITWPDVHRHSVAIQFMDHYHLSDSLMFQLSATYEQVTSKAHSEFGLRQMKSLGYDGSIPSTYPLFSGQIRLEKTWKNNIITHLKLGVAQRQPTVSEGFGYYLFNSQDAYDYLGNPQLKKEQALKLSAGIQVRPFTRSQLNITGYTYHFQNYIFGQIDPTLDGMTIGAAGVKVYENIPIATILGTEFQWRIPLTPYLQVINLSSFTWGQDANKNPLPLIPPFTNNTTIIAIVNRTEITASCLINSDQSRYNAAAGETFSPGFSMIQFSAFQSFRVKKHPCKVGITGKNMLDTYYWNHLDWNNIPQPGRSIIISLQMEL